MSQRVLPFLTILLAATIVGGVLRGLVLFIPGIAGMAIGGITGYLCGRLGRQDPEALWDFSERGWMSVGAGALYGVATAATVSVLNVGAMGVPLEWLGDVINGFRGELFIGWSRNSYQGVGGKLEGAWWVIFNIVDTGLFGFLFLVTTGVGAVPMIEEADEDSRTAPEEGSNGKAAEGPPPIDHRPLKSGLMTACACALVTVLIVVVLGFWPILAHGAYSGKAAGVSPQSLQGEWVFDAETTLFGRTEEERRFNVSVGLAGELRCYSATEGRFLVTVNRQPSGAYEGLLFWRGSNMLGIRMRPSDTGDELVFVVKWPGAGGDLRERVMRARRVAGDPTGDAP